MDVWGYFTSIFQLSVSGFIEHAHLHNVNFGFFPQCLELILLLESVSVNDLWKFQGTNWTWMGGDTQYGSSGHFGDKGKPSEYYIPSARGHFPYFFKSDKLHYKRRFGCCLSINKTCLCAHNCSSGPSNLAHYFRTKREQALER